MEERRGPELQSHEQHYQNQKDNPCYVVNRTMGIVWHVSSWVYLTISHHDILYSRSIRLRLKTNLACLSGEHRQPPISGPDVGCTARVTDPRLNAFDFGVDSDEQFGAGCQVGSATRPQMQCTDARFEIVGKERPRFVKSLVPHVGWCIGIDAHSVFMTPATRRGGAVGPGSGPWKLQLWPFRDFMSASRTRNLHAPVWFPWSTPPRHVALRYDCGLSTMKPSTLATRLTG